MKLVANLIIYGKVTVVHQITDLKELFDICAATENETVHLELTRIEDNGEHSIGFVLED